MTGLFRETDDIENDPIIPPTLHVTKKEPVDVKIEPIKFDGVAVDTEYVPSSAILMWGQGSVWTCDYYSQILGRSNEPKPLDLHLPPIEQQYRYLKRIPLKVTSPLSISQEDSTSNTMVVTGGGYTYPFLTPNVGDMFVADIGDGRTGVFTITKAERATILKDSVYNVEWIMVSESTAIILENLASKVQVTYHFSMQSLECGCKPFVTGEVAANIENYNKELQELIRMYFTDFLSLEHSTLLVPDQLSKTYDHFITRFILKVLSTRDDLRLRHVRELNVMSHPVMKQPTLWDSIINVNMGYHKSGTNKVSLVSTRLFRGHPLLQAVGFTGIPKIVFPSDAPTDVDARYDFKNLEEIIGVGYRAGTTRRPLPTGFVEQSERDIPYFKRKPDDVSLDFWEIPEIIKPVVVDDYYVLSESFYSGDKTTMSRLELLMTQFFNGEEIDMKMFNSVLATAKDWDNLERFYYHPLLIVLLKTFTG